MAFCIYCGKQLLPETKYCIYCGAEQLPKIYYPSQPDNVEKTSSKPKIIAIVSLIVVCLLMGSVSTVLILQHNKEDNNKELVETSDEHVKELSKLLDDSNMLEEIPSALINETDYKSGTKAFTIKLADGLTASADENAMDTKREITAKRLSDDELQTKIMDYPYGSNFVLDGYELHMGLSEEECIPGVLSLEVDLASLEIPEILWPYTSLVRSTDSGAYEQLITNVDKGKLVAQTNKNSIIYVTFGLTLGYYVYDDLKDYYLLGSDKTYFKTTIIPGYEVVWPTDMQVADYNEVKGKLNRLDKIFNDYGITAENGLAKEIMNKITYRGGEKYRSLVRGCFKQVFEDDEFQSILKELENPEWQQKYFWPYEVQKSIEALKAADQYLYNERYFRKPRHVVRIAVLKSWPHEPGTFALTLNPTFASPAIHINASTLPQNKQMFESKPNFYQGGIDELYLTIAHELFHVIQCGYIAKDEDAYLWFWEATAIVLQAEAREYYLRKKIIKTPILDDPEASYYETFCNSLGLFQYWPSSDYTESFNRVQGYTAAHWIMFLRDRYYKKSKDLFLERLIRKFSWSKDCFIALRDMTSSSDEVMSTDFSLFCARENKNMQARFSQLIEGGKQDTKGKDKQFYYLVKDNEYCLSESNPYAKIAIQYNPMSVNYKFLSYDVKNPESDSNVLVIRTGEEAIKADSVIYRIQENKDTDFKVTGSGLYKVIKGKQKGTACVQEIHSYTNQSSIKNVKSYYDAILMTKPMAPIVELKDNELIIGVAGDTLLYEKNIVTGFRISVATPNGSAMEFITKEKELRIPLTTSGDIDWEMADTLNYEAMARAADVLNNNTEKSYVVRVTEMIEISENDVIYGPVGKETSSVIDTGLTSNVNLIGNWSGDMLGVGEITVQITDGEEGHDYTIYISIYEDIKFYGDNAGNGTVSLTGPIESTIVVNSEKELYLVAPPVTLHR